MTLTGEPPGPGVGWPVDLRRGTVQVLDTHGKPAGTGFLVGERLLVTCAHVLPSNAGGREPPADPVTVRFVHLDDAARTARVEPGWWRGTHAEDVAFLRLADAPPPRAQAFALGASRGVRGHRVTTFGFPVTAPKAGHYGYGVAGNQIRGNGGADLLQLTECSEVTEGFSGGPVLDELTGLVVGMVDSIPGSDRRGRGHETAYVTPTETLREICPELSVSPLRPYRGLEPFTVDDAAWFHGRGRAVDTVLDSLRRDRRFLALLGPSGSGKSSLIHAGVRPALARGEIPGSDRWGWLSVRPGAQPFAQLEEAGLPGAAAGLPDAAQRWLAAHPEHERLVLVVDQCEELLTTTESSLRRVLLEQLAAVVAQQLAVTVVMVVRDDFYGRLAAAAPDLMRLVERALVNVPALVQADELRAIIELPAVLAGLTIEPNLVERIVGDAARAAPPADGPGSGAAITVLPLLEFALDELWHRGEDGRLTHHAYAQIGGVVGGLARWCDQAYQALSPAQRLLVPRIVTSLVRLGNEAANISPTRHRRTRAELRAGRAGAPRDSASRDSGSDVDAVVDVLAGRRLLITSRDPASGEPVVELVHEAVIREWGLLRQWLADDHDFLSWRGDLEADCAQWKASTGRRSPHDPELLLRGSALEQALDWLPLRRDELSEEFTEFIALSDRTQQQRLTRDRYLVRLLAILLVLALGFGAVSVFQTRRVGDEQELALSRQLAASATSQLAIDPERSLLLAREAHKVRPTPEAEAALRQATLDSRVRATLRGHRGTVFGVVFSPDGKRVASAGEEGTVRIWDAAGAGNLVVLPGHHSVYSVAFSPDGKQVTSASADGMVRIWDAAGAGDPVVLPGHQRAVLGVAFSPDGKRVVSAGEDGTVRIWDAAGGVSPVVLPGHQGTVFGVAFSPDGKRVVSAGKDAMVRIWDAAGGVSPVVLPGHEGTVFGVAFSPDGKRVVSAGEDGTVRIWDTAGAGDPVVLPGHHSVYSVAFSPDGKRVASADKGAIVRIWDAAGAGNPVVLPGHQDPVLGVAFSPDSKRVASAGADAMVRIWDAAGAGNPVVLPGHQGTVYGVAFSPDGKRVASAGADRTVRIWDATGAGSPVVLPGHDGVVRGHDGVVLGVAFSPDGKRVASAGADGTVRIWDATGADSPVVLRGSQNPVFSVAFSPDGKRVVSAGGDAMVRIWDVAGAVSPIVLRGHDGTVLGVAFSPDGKRVASAGADGTVRIWDVAGAGSPVVLPGHQGPVYSVAFSPSGQQVASAGGDTVVRIWDVTGAGDPVVLRDRRAVRDVVFSPDGRRVAGASADGMVRVWECEVCLPLEEVLTLAKQRSTRELTCVERSTFLHEPPCP